MRSHPLNEHDSIEDALRRGGCPATQERELNPQSTTQHPAADAAVRLSARLAADGLADVSYATADSPFGTLLLAVTGRGLVRVAFPEENVDSVLEGLARRIS